jgi:hypothetical protein
MLPQFPEGLYLAKVINQYFTTSSQKETTGFCLQTRILKSLDNPDDKCGALRVITFWLTDNTYMRVFRELKSLGFDGDSLEDLDPDSESFHDLSQREIHLKCTHEEDQNGELREKWNLHLERPPLQDKSALRRFNRMWQQKRGRVDNDAKETDPVSTEADVLL